MRAWFWTLFLAVLAVATAVELRLHPGNVLLLIWPWRIELSLSLALFLLLGGFTLLYMGLRVLAWMTVVPNRIRGWRVKHVQIREQDLLEHGWMGLLEGQFVQAEKLLSRLLKQTHVKKRRVLAALSVARAAHMLGEYDRRNKALDQARIDAENHVGLTEAAITVLADMLLDEGRAQEALTVLGPLQASKVRHVHTMKLLLRAHRVLGHHERVFTLSRSLFRRHAIPKIEAYALIENAAAAQLRSMPVLGEEWLKFWKNLKPDERLLPEVALAGAEMFERAGELNETAQVLEAAIAHQFNPRLVAWYANCKVEQVPRRLEKAEEWLKKHLSDPDLLRALGVLCLTAQLWGSAERYLIRSLRSREDGQVHCLLGSLYDRLDRNSDAVRHWRLASLASSISIPILVGDGPLPAADMRNDPYSLSAHSPSVVWQDNAFHPTPSSTGSTTDIENYFDSAPIVIEDMKDFTEEVSSVKSSALQQVTESSPILPNQKSI